ncbi:MAG: endopeptidase La [Tissierellia bacterium]|nr:endopeptidase La [Tissierellia bacterium]
MSQTSIFPVIPLRNLTVFPQMVTHFDVGRPKSIKALEMAEMSGEPILLVTQRDGRTEEPTADEFFHLGTLSKVRQMLKLPGGNVRVLVEGFSRAKIIRLTDRLDFIEAEVEVIEEQIFSKLDKEMSASIRLILEELEKYSNLNERLIPGIVDSLQELDNPGELVDLAASYLPLKQEDNQRLLETVDVKERLLLLHSILRLEIEYLELGNKINQRVQKQINKGQKEYFLKEQLRAIHKELGDSDDEEVGLEYIDKIKAKDMPEEIREKALEEAERLRKLSMHSPEHGVLRTYLDWIISLPWVVEKQESIDLERSKMVLDEDHYGLSDVKERILEFLAVRKLKDSSKGPIICLVGPPGVGKTSIAKSIARALDREYVRMSLGGVRDEAEIRGHRRTYIGALPGRIISSIKKADAMDPLFLFDEVDKIGSDFRGDPASALLEVLDPEQNSTFTDYYLDLPYDLSHVFFITTANTTQTIPRPLLDRMEIIEISGYTEEEKYEIAIRHLLPKQLEENGIKKSQFSITSKALKNVISHYTREAGVRGLEKVIASLCRKAAIELVEERNKTFRVSERNLEKILGPYKYTFDLVGVKDEVGIVTGLAWTPVGGQTLNVEVGIVPGTGKLALTGQLGDVMKESAMAAISYVKSKAEYYGIEVEFSERDVHIHVPEGAIPKDGPSAGVTITTAIISALTNTPVKRDLAMTGEITLRGKVLPIGGLKEKLLAALRMGISRVIIPKGNNNDLMEVPDYVKEQLTITTVEEVDEVIKLALSK